jgi:hypothetical protein
MKNLIYQYWTVMPGKKMPHGVEVGKQFMSDYAKSIGADYKFNLNPTWAKDKCNIPEYYNAFEPIYNPEYYEQYDNILFCDLDIIPVDNLNENIFEQNVEEIGICRETHKEKLRHEATGGINAKGDEAWARICKDVWKTDMPRNEEKKLKVFNSGVVLYTQKGMEKARKGFVPFQEYIGKMQGLNRFYSIDQNYLHAMLHIANINYTEMNEGWNSYVHYHGQAGITGVRPVWDCRTKDTKFVHVQLRNADNQNYEWHRTIANRPVSEWVLS